MRQPSWYHALHRCFHCCAQADKAWAIYRQLVPGRRQVRQAQQPGAQQQQQPQPAAQEAAGAAAPGPAHGAEEPHPWEGRLAARQEHLEAAAARLVRELRLDALPLNEYAYGALLTALSRVRWPGWAG